MPDSLKAVIDSLVQAAVAASDSARAAEALTATPWYVPILEHPLFKLLWPVVVAAVGFFLVKWINRREKRGDESVVQERQRSDSAIRIANFLDTAADMLQPLLDRIREEGEILLERPVSYPPAENVLAYLDEFTALRARLAELNDVELENKIVLWHKAATAGLTEVRDYRLMAPGMYMKTYASRGNQVLGARFVAIHAGLLADIANARALVAQIAELTLLPPPLPRSAASVILPPNPRIRP